MGKKIEKKGREGLGLIEECCQLRLLGRKFVSMIGVVPTSVGAAVKAAGRLTGWRQLVFSLWLGGVLCECAPCAGALTLRSLTQPCACAVSYVTQLCKAFKYWAASAVVFDTLHTA